MIICLSHLGWEVSDYPCDRVIPQTSGVDLVLDGHTHTYLNQLEYVKDKSGHLVPVDQNGKHAVFVGKIQVEMQKK